MKSEPHSSVLLGLKVINVNEVKTCMKPNMIPPTTNVEMVVPTNAKTRMDPMFRKKNLFFML